jgi:drug/metabolite transporter (DMT)-like permease
VHCEYTDRYGYLEDMTRLTPVLLVVLWSSGFVGATLSATAAPAITTLLWRYVAAAGALLLVVAILRRRYRRGFLAREAVVGLLGQGGYLLGVFRAAELGLPAGTTALVASLQPAVVAGLLARLGRGGDLRQSVGLAVGLAGVALVVAPDLGAGGSLAGLAWVVGGMASMAAATLAADAWRAGPGHDLLDSLAVQATVALLFFGAVAVTTGQAAPPAAATFWWAVGWLVLLSFAGGYGAYLWVLRSRGPVTVSTWLYLTPPVTAVWAWLMFGEPVSVTAAAGFVVSLAGVLLVTRPVSARRRAGRRRVERDEVLPSHACHA